MTAVIAARYGVDMAGDGDRGGVPVGGEPHRRRAVRHHGPDDERAAAGATGCCGCAASRRRRGPRRRFRAAIDSTASIGIRHAVTGADYGTVRTAAFMGYRIIAEHRRTAGAIDGIERARHRRSAVARLSGEHHAERVRDALRRSVCRSG